MVYYQRRQSCVSPSKTKRRRWLKDLSSDGKNSNSQKVLERKQQAFLFVRWGHKQIGRYILGRKHNGRMKVPVVNCWWIRGCRWERGCWWGWGCERWCCSWWGARDWAVCSVGIFWWYGRIGCWSPIVPTITMNMQIHFIHSGFKLFHDDLLQIVKKQFFQQTSYLQK